MQGDIAKAFSNRCRRPLSAETLQQLGLEIDEDGFCCSVGSGKALVCDYEYDDDASQPTNFAHTPSPESSRESSYDGQLESETSTSEVEVSESRMASQGKKRKRKGVSLCGCMLTDETLRHIFSGFQDGDSTKDAHNCREVLRTFGQKVYKNQDQINIDTICSDHSRQFCNPTKTHPSGG